MNAVRARMQTKLNKRPIRVDYLVQEQVEHLIRNKVYQGEHKATFYANSGEEAEALGRLLKNQGFSVDRWGITVVDINWENKKYPLWLKAIAFFVLLLFLTFLLYMFIQSCLRLLS